MTMTPGGYSRQNPGGYSGGSFRGNSPGGYVPPIANISAAFGVNLDTYESVKWSLYDSAVYPAAGVANLPFFQVQKGQGTAVLGGGAKTLSDTNMTLAGQLPANQYFIVNEVEVLFLPTTPSVTAELPAVFGAQSAAQLINDAFVFERAGNLTFTIGSKDYIQDAPIMKFPPQNNFQVSGALADATTAAATSQSRIAYATSVGKAYTLSPNNLLLIPTQNFILNLNWPEGLQALPSGNPAVVRTTLNGLLYRAAQ